MNPRKVFRMSVINAIVEIRLYRTATGEVDLKKCCRMLRVTPGPTATYDYATATELAPLPGLLDGTIESRESVLREILRYLLFHLRPNWGLLIPHGRQVFLSNVSDDIQQCFESAGLIQPLPDPISIAWWDSISQLFRSASVLGRVELGRRGEALTVKRERQILDNEGYVDLNPRWIALEDDSVGYDVISFEIREDAILTKYIEVKASEQKPFAFFISENEWRVAELLADSYVFHFWSLPSEKMAEVRVAEVAPHIPENKGLGTWKKAMIIWPGLNDPVESPPA